MTEQLQVVSNHTTSDKLTFDLPKNYSQLLNTLEQLAIGLESTFANLSIDHKAVGISLNGRNGSATTTDLSEDIYLAKSAHGEHVISSSSSSSSSNHLANEVSIAHVFSDIWIGVILTLLIVSVIFFICAGFLYHKYQQWKSSYRSNNEPNIEICRHCPPDFEAESLPSYTIVSGLPTYDDALEEFRKAGIILSPHLPMIKIFDVNGDTKDPQMLNFDPNTNDLTVTSATSGDAVSVASVCVCGVNSVFNHNNTVPTPPQTPMMGKHTKINIPGTAQVIELTPEQLAQLSHKRLSLQITFNNSVRRPTRKPMDLYRAANRNNLLRLSALNNANANANARNPASQPNSPGTSTTNNPFGFPSIHRSTSSGSLRNEQIQENARMQHRGSLS